MNLVVTITYNAFSSGILEPFFACLRAQTASDFSVLVIDNASSDGTREFLEDLRLPNLEVVFNDENIGFARACNQAIELAQQRNADCITFLNNDTEFDPELIGAIGASLRDSGADILSPRIPFFDHPERIWFERGSFPWSRGLVARHDGIGLPAARTREGRYRETTFVPGCCLIADMRVFERIPGLDERYFVYWEDADLCKTLSARGARIVTDTQLECLHKVSISTGGAFSDFSVFHFNRGHMIFVRKHYGFPALAWALSFSIAKAIFNAARGKMAIRQLPIWLRAIRSGLRERLD